MIKHDVQQGTYEWLRLRAGIPTASELNDFLCLDGTLRKGDGFNTYLHTKLAEKWIEGPLPSFSGGAMEQGALREEEALRWFEMEAVSPPERVGFVTTDDGRFGSSPDLWLPREQEGAEIKCPQPVHHLQWLALNACPPKHLLQCQGGMLVTGAKRWWFVSYCPKFPPLKVVVPRDEELIGRIAASLEVFNAQLDEKYDWLCTENGGPPRRRAARAPIVLDPDPFATEAL